MIIPPPPVEVNLPTGDPTFDIIALLVSTGAALVGLVAAIAAWRAATAARAATAHSATAANAAQKTAEYERASFEDARAERRRAQADQVVVSWGSIIRGSGQAEVMIEIINRSEAPVTDVSYFGLFDKEQITDEGRMSPLAPSTQTLWLGLTREVPGEFNPSRGQGLIRFTDANGIRWERRSGSSPVELTD